MENTNSIDYNEYTQVMQYDNWCLRNVKAGHDAQSAMLRECINLLELEDKQQKTAEARNKEDAYSCIVENNSGLSVPGITGSLKQVYKVGVAEVVYVMLDPLYRKDNYYIVKAENGNTIRFEEPVLYQDRKFLSAMAILLGRPARIYSTSKNIAELVREYIAAKAKRVQYQFYYGWVFQNNQWVFLLRGNSTHAPAIPETPDEISKVKVFEEKSRTQSLEATVRITAMFLKIHTVEKAVLFLWWHMSFLSTILHSYNLAPAMGLCICCQGPLSQLCLEKMFGWFGDEVISLGADPNQLCRKMADRKDEPLVLSDRLSREGNSELVHRIVADGKIPFGTKDERSTELLALVTLLSNGTSPLCCKNNFFTIEMDDYSWEDYDANTITAFSGYIADYLRGFSSYVRDHIDQLLKCMRDGSLGLENYDLSELSPEAFSTFTTMRGMRMFIREWQKYLLPSPEQDMHWQKALAIDDKILGQLLETASTVGDDLTSIFVSISKKMVQFGKLLKVSVNHAPNLGSVADSFEGIVFTDEEYWYFDREAFSYVAHLCCTNTAVMARFLNANNLLKGSRASAKTYMTRISVYDDEGHVHRLRVYALPKTLFEEPFSGINEEVFE